MRRALFAALMVAGVLVPLGLRGAYGQNHWMLEQQLRQKMVMSAIRAKLTHLAPGTKTVLVTGLDFPFSPFDHPRSLYEYGPTLPAFSVIAYQPKGAYKIMLPSPVRWISPDQAGREAFDAVWAFGEDGAAIDWTLSAADRDGLKALGLDPATLLVYPQVAKALGLGGASGVSLNLDGYHLLQCGTAHLGYSQYRLALICLKASEAGMPGNPYPYFYSGLADENLGLTAQAAANFAQAVALDSKATPNPAFKAGLLRTQTRAPVP